MLRIVLGIIEAHDFGALCVIHVFWIVVIFVEELLDHLVVVVLLSGVYLVQLENA